jgi:hypothetical protein
MFANQLVMFENLCLKWLILIFDDLTVNGEGSGEWGAGSFSNIINLFHDER